MGRIFLLAFVAMVSACTSDPPVPAKPKGTYQWRNDELYSQNLSESQLEAKFQIAKNTCKIQSLSVPVPSPSCTQVPKNCSSYGPGAAQGMCQATPNYQTCNYSSVDAAYSAQDQILKSCMNLSGWREVWVPAEQVSAMGSVQAAVEKQNKHEKSCLLIGELAKSVVGFRNDGVPQAWPDKDNADKYVSGGRPENLYKLNKNIIAWVYGNPSVGPDEAQSIWKNECLEKGFND